MEQNRTVRSIPCADVAERERTLQIIGAPGRLSLVVPPGTVAHLHPRQYELLRRALLEVMTTAWKEPTS